MLETMEEKKWGKEKSGKKNRSVYLKGFCTIDLCYVVACVGCFYCRFVCSGSNQQASRHHAL